MRPESLGIPIGTLTSRLARGREALQALLGAQRGNDDEVLGRDADGLRRRRAGPRRARGDRGGHGARSRGRARRRASPAMAAQVRGAYDGVLEEPVPERLAALVARAGDCAGRRPRRATRRPAHCGRAACDAGLGRARRVARRRPVRRHVPDAIARGAYEAVDGRARRARRAGRGLGFAARVRARRLRRAHRHQLQGSRRRLLPDVPPAARRFRRGPRLSQRRGLALAGARRRTCAGRRTAASRCDADPGAACGRCRDRRRAAGRGGRGRGARRAVGAERSRS